AIAGACCAFSAFNLRPAAVYLGDAGSMFLGFLLPALALELVHTAARPVQTGWAVICLLALPVIEIVITITRRIAHGRPCWLSAPDNLTYALRRRRVGMSGALVVHVVAQALLVLGAVLVFERKLAAPIAIVIVAAQIIGWATATRGADVHGTAVRWTRWARTFAFVIVAGIALAAGAGMLTVVRAYQAATDGASTLDI